MNVLIVHTDPEGCPVITITELTGTQDFEAVVGGPVEFVRTPFEGVAGYVHEHGKVLNLPVNDAGTRLCAESLGWDDYIVGPLVLFGFDPDRAEYKDCPLDMAVIAEFLTD